MTVGNAGIGDKSPVDSRIPGATELAMVQVIRPKGSPLPASDPGLCRASVHSGATVVDLSLPDAIPVAILIPSIVDILKAHDPGNDAAAKRCHLSPLGAAALNPSLSLAQNGIGDGAVLVLSQSAAPPPGPRYDDAAEAVSATLHAPTPAWRHTGHRQAARITGAAAASCLTGVGMLVLIRNAFGVGAAQSSGTTAEVATLTTIVALASAVVACRTHRVPMAGPALNVIATAFAAVAGFLAVSGAPGYPQVLLAASAAAVVSVLAIRASACGVGALTAVASVAMLIAAAALVGTVTAAPVHVVGSVSTLVSLGLLGVTPRVSIVLAGLSPQLDSEDIEPSGTRLAAKAVRADAWLLSLLATFSSSAAAGAAVTVLAGAHRLCCIVFGAATGTVLLLRSRCGDGRRMLLFAISGTAVIATTFGVSAWGVPEHGPYIAAATALLSAAAMHLGFIAPAKSFSPIARRSVELLEFLAFVAMVPLTCWICGVYGAVRAVHIP
jgi:type VII secretion integral membrane protein EccD